MIKYPTFTDYSGRTWQVVTIHIVVSSRHQAELECQTTGLTTTKMFRYSVDTGMLVQDDPNELVSSHTDDDEIVCNALKMLFIN